MRLGILATWEGEAPFDRAHEDDLEILPPIRLASTLLDRDALIRTARVYADSIRRRLRVPLGARSS